MQKEMSFFYKTGLRRLPDELIKTCKDGQDAFKLNFDQRTVKYSQSVVAAACEMPGSQFSCILQGSKHPPSNKRIRYMEVTGNIALIQYEAMQLGIQIIFNETLEEKFKRVEREAKELGLTLIKESIEQKAARLEKELTALREKLSKVA